MLMPSRSTSFWKDARPQGHPQGRTHISARSPLWVLLRSWAVVDKHRFGASDLQATGVMLAEHPGTLLNAQGALQTTVSGCH